MIKIYAAGSSNERSEMSTRFLDKTDVESLYAQLIRRFPKVKNIVSKVVRQDAGPETIIQFIDQTYRIADPALIAIPPETDIGYDSWCPRNREGAKYWDRVPLNAMINVGYFNCLYATALTARVFSEIEFKYSLLTCPAVPTHPFVNLADQPDRLFSFNHDGLRCYRGQVEIKGIIYVPGSLTPISDYSWRDGIYGLSIPEHFIMPTRLVPAAENVERAIRAFADLATSLDGYPRLEHMATIIRVSIIPRLRMGPVPFTRTIEEVETGI